MYRRDGVLYRQIGPSAIDDWTAFVSCGLAARLIGAGRLIPYEVAPITQRATEDARAVIRPEPIDFISYPYSWTFGELKDAALLTLDVQLEAMASGWTLKDASAYNVQFRDARPVLIDSLSFEPLADGAPWIAYRQFCEHFLAPLALVAYTDARMARLLRADPDGIPLDLASKLLPWRTHLNFGLLSHVHVHARAQGRHASREGSAAAARAVRIGRPRLRSLVSSLRSTVAGLEWQPKGTEWFDYAGRAPYSERATQDKVRLVELFARRAPGSRAWSLGANTGRYTRIIAGTGKRVIAFDIDPAAAEQHYRSVRAENRPGILPLVLDVANPSPGLGWGGAERRSLLDRADADLVVALALIHHLAITRNVPLRLILDFFGALAPWAIVEFVPKDDPMVRHLLGTRRDVFEDYSIDGFRRAALATFAIEAEEPIADSQRVLFLLRRLDREPA